MIGSLNKSIWLSAVFVSTLSAPGGCGFVGTFDFGGMTVVLKIKLIRYHVVIEDSLMYRSTIVGGYNEVLQRPKDIIVFKSRYPQSRSFVEMDEGFFTESNLLRLKMLSYRKNPESKSRLELHNLLTPKPQTYATREKGFVMKGLRRGPKVRR